MVGSGDEEEESGGEGESLLWACKANKMRERIVSLSFGWGSRQGGKDTRHAELMLLLLLLHAAHYKFSK